MDKETQTLNSNYNNNNDFVLITETKLILQEMINKVSCNSAGAISTFSGTTRDNFGGKKVLHLEYEAYVPMAEKEMWKIVTQVREKWDVCKIALAHKIGHVPVGETSVLVVISSEHRRESLEAVEWAIDEIKAVVPVWKKEFYEDGSVWKENSECHFSGNQRVHQCCSKRQQVDILNKTNSQ